METKKVEILLATYNGEQYLREQLDSILNQDYDNWILRVCDDASTDGTFRILTEYQEQYPDKFILTKNQEGFGTAKKNFMHLIQNSTCDYVMCCDQDDVWLPNKIRVTVEAMKKNEQDDLPILIHTDLKVVDSNLNVLSESFFEHSNFRKEFQLNEILIQNFVTGCTMMMNRSMVELMRRVEDCNHILMHDWVASVMATAVGKVVFVDVPTMLYRQHAINSVGAKKYGVALFISKVREAKMKKSIMDTMVQAGEIAKLYQDILDEEKYQFIHQYATLWEKNKVERVMFYIRHKVLKKGLPRKVCQLIVG